MSYLYKFQCDRCFIISGLVSSNPDDAPLCCSREPMTPIGSPQLAEFCERCAYYRSDRVSGYCKLLPDGPNISGWHNKPLANCPLRKEHE